MKTLNISGTLSESFSIGHGNGIIELRVIEGELYFRNQGQAYKKVLGSNSSIVLSPLQWNPETQYFIGNLFYKDSGLWMVMQDFTSNNNFLSQGHAYRRIFDFRGQSIINIDSINEYQINIEHSDLVVVTGQRLGEVSINLPSKNSLVFQTKYLIYNNSTATIKIYDSNSNFINTILPNYKYNYFLDGFSSTGWSTSILENSSILETFGIQKNIAFLEPGESVQVFGASGVFIGNTGTYKFFENNDATVYGEIFYTSGTNNVKINSFNRDIVKNDIPNKICFFSNNNQLYLKNNTNQNKTIVFHKFY